MPTERDTERQASRTETDWQRWTNTDKWLWLVSPLLSGHKEKNVCPGGVWWSCGGHCPWVRCAAPPGKESQPAGVITQLQFIAHRVIQQPNPKLPQPQRQHVTQNYGGLTMEHAPISRFTTGSDVVPFLDVCHERRPTNAKWPSLMDIYGRPLAR